MPLRSRFIRLHNIPSRKVGTSNIKHLPLILQYFKRFPHFFPRRGTINVMHLIQVQIIRLHASQRSLTSSANMQRSHTVRVGPIFQRTISHVTVQLSCQHSALSSTSTQCKPLSENLLCNTLTLLPAVNICRIKEVDPVLKRTVHDFEAVFLSRFRTKVHGSKTQTTYLQPSSSE